MSQDNLRSAGNPEPAAVPPADQESTGQQFQDQLPAGQQLGGEQPASEQPASEQPAGHVSPDQQPRDQQPASQEPTTAEHLWWLPSSQQPDPSGLGAGQAGPPAHAGQPDHTGQTFAGQQPYPGQPFTGQQSTTGQWPYSGQQSGASQPPYPGQPFAARQSATATMPVVPPKRRKTSLIAASTIALALVAGFGGGALASSLNDNSSGTVASALATTGTSSVVSTVKPAASGTVEQVADAILPSVLSVLSRSSSSEGEGSGIVLSADGLVLTNNHVISGATDLQVQFNDGTTAKATVVGADTVDDLAVIKAEGVSGLTPATLGSSADLQVGQEVVAVGSPLGLSATVTSGIVSALNRPVATSDAQQQQPQQLPGFGQDQQQQSQTATQATVINAIQTDAAINPGNSGGPLVDMSGKVIGINSAIASLSSGSGESGSIGVGFAIPIDQAKRIADEIIKTGKASHAVLGASVADATVNGNALLTSGAKISQLTSGGGAEAAGLQVGDVITKVGEQQVESSDALVAAIRSQAPNGTVAITYTRGSDTATVTVTLGSSSD